MRITLHFLHPVVKVSEVENGTVSLPASPPSSLIYTHPILLLPHREFSYVNNSMPHTPFALISSPF